MILKEIVDLMNIGCKSVNKEIVGMKVCELGDQRMKWNEFGTGKKYLLSRGVKEHISIDLNGLNGAIKIDLSKPINNWTEYFDMVTNYGTAEHVSGGIYECYQNIHNFTKIDGIMINVGPPARKVPWHSPYHYEVWFFKKLAEINDYEHILSEIRVCSGRRGAPPENGCLVCSVLIKRNNNKFCSKEEFIGIKGIEGLN